MIGPRLTKRWPWLAFGCASLWVILIRVPLIVNAENHLDSDLAVDGLTLLEATQGHGRWHYPGTPFMGTGPVLLSLPQALIWGVNSSTLVSGGTVAYLGLLATTFWMAWRTAGPVVAAWSLVPLTFASTGALWLSARITGGHLVAAAWHAGSFALLAGLLSKGGRTRALALGLWCGLGLYLDSMLSVTIVGIFVAGLATWFAMGFPRESVMAALFFMIGFLGGVWPRPVGSVIDPHDAYSDQFALLFEKESLRAHARLLVAECLPRLISGHNLPGLESDPDLAALTRPTLNRRREPFSPLSLAVVCLSLTLALSSIIALATTLMVASSLISRLVCAGLSVSMIATLVGFVLNRNIFNSDNYRYLVGLLPTMALGFGLLAERTSRGSLSRRIALMLSVLLLAGLMTADTLRWYARFGWVDSVGRPLKKHLEDPILDWLKAHPDVSWIEGDYWDIYRLVFLAGGKLKGNPVSIYPNRFPEWRVQTDPVILVRFTPEGVASRNQAIRRGYRMVARNRGVTVLKRLANAEAR